MTTRRRSWFALGIAAVVVALLLLGLAGRGQLPDVTVAPVTRQAVESWITSNGKVEPIRPFVLRSRLDTFVKRVAVTEGQKVKRGQLLLQLDATGAAANLAQARQDLLTARHELEAATAGGPPDALAQLTSQLAKTQATRDHLAAQGKALTQLVADKAATQDELAQNKLQLAQAEAELKYLKQKKQVLEHQAKFDVSQNRLRIDQAEAQIRDLTEKVASANLTSPVNGTVYALPIHAGSYVHVGDELADVADLEQVRVRAYVDEVDLGALDPNELVEIRWEALPGRVWDGATEAAPAQVVPYRDRSVGEVLCSVNNNDLRLLPNVNVDVRIRAERHNGALVIPRAAVQGEGTDRFVYLVQGDRLRTRAVRLGIASTDRFEVLGGLTEGDKVAIPGSVNLQDGLEIHPVEAH